MIDLPIGKAIVAVESNLACDFECMNEDYKCAIDCCNGCAMQDEKLEGLPDPETCGCMSCTPETRKDKKNAIFKLVEYPDFIMEINEMIKNS